MPAVTDPGAGISGYGTQLRGASTLSSGVTMITKVSIGDMEVDVLEISTMNTGLWKKFIAGMKDAKEIKLELRYHKTNMAAVLTALGAANENWTVTFPDGSTFVCSGFFRALGVQTEINSIISQSATLKLSGAPTFTAGS